NNKKTPFDAPKDYFLEFTDQVLTLHFTLPFKTPVKAQNLEIEVYDPTYFVDFTFNNKEPVSLVGAPAACKLAFARPADSAPTAGAPVNEQFFSSLEPGNNYGAAYANRISVKCP